MHNQRFFSYLTLFSFFMILLVTADNYLLMFLAWEGIGVVSYLLINFWFTRIAATKAAVLALTQNRVGDTLLTLGLFGMLWAVGNLDYSTVFSIIPYMNETITTIIALLLLGGASAKSAQLFLNTWLPHSMEGFFTRQNIIYRYKAFFSILILYILITSLEDITATSETNKIFTFSIVPLWTNKIHQSMIGDLLGDGHLRYGNKNKKGEVTGNCNFSITLKSRDHTFYFWKNIYKDICTDTPPNPWPPAKAGKTVSQYHFATRSFKELTLLHTKWYKLDPGTNKYLKIVPLDINKHLAPISLAHWIMGDGYWSENTLYLCTDSFTYAEILLLVNSLNTVLNLSAAPAKRTKDNKQVCWRIRLSSKKENIFRLRTIVSPFMISSLKYKIGEL